jgi:hypothetical protein
MPLLKREAGLEAHDLASSIPTWKFVFKKSAEPQLPTKRIVCHGAKHATAPVGRGQANGPPLATPTKHNVLADLTLRFARSQ